MSYSKNEQINLIIEILLEYHYVKSGRRRDYMGNLSTRQQKHKREYIERQFGTLKSFFDSLDRSEINLDVKAMREQQGIAFGDAKRLLFKPDKMLKVWDWVSSVTVPSKGEGNVQGEGNLHNVKNDSEDKSNNEAEVAEKKERLRSIFSHLVDGNPSDSGISKINIDNERIEKEPVEEEEWEVPDKGVLGSDGQAVEPSSERVSIIELLAKKLESSVDMHDPDVAISQIISDSLESLGFNSEEELLMELSVFYLNKVC